MLCTGKRELSDLFQTRYLSVAGLWVFSPKQAVHDHWCPRSNTNSETHPAASPHEEQLPSLCDLFRDTQNSVSVGLHGSFTLSTLIAILLDPNRS